MVNFPSQIICIQNYKYIYAFNRCHCQTETCIPGSAYTCLHHNNNCIRSHLLCFLLNKKVFNYFIIIGMKLKISL